MSKTIIGVDEVGRGPVAGPVTVCAFATADIDVILKNAPAPLRDSKMLTKIQRGKWMEYLLKMKQEQLCTFAIASVSARGIDDFGISPSIKSALATALNDLRYDPKTVEVFLDGSLKAPEEYIHQSTTIKGDSLIPIISLASIVAKESRDKKMAELAIRYPEYGFEKHVGYGTKLHFDAIRQWGTTPEHRVSFLKNLT